VGTVNITTVSSLKENTAKKVHVIKKSCHPHKPVQYFRSGRNEYATADA